MTTQLSALRVTEQDRAEAYRLAAAPVIADKLSNAVHVLEAVAAVDIAALEFRDRADGWACSLGRAGRCDPRLSGLRYPGSGCCGGRRVVRSRV